MLKRHLILAALLAASLTACSSDKNCQDFCGAGNVCDASGQCVPLQCTPACGAGTACQMGACVPVQAVSCTEAYPGCASCDTSGTTPAWVGQCGAGTTCAAANDSCVPLACEPACGPGTACQMGACVAVEAVTCTAAYPGCSACNTAGATPTWVGLCGANTACDTASDRCVSVATVHVALGQPGEPLAGPFTSGYQVTAACIGCHPAAAGQIMASQHFTWSGSAPDLLAADLVTAVTAPVGKVNLINNFCVGVPSNEKRCDQCHAGYGGDPDAAKPQKTARAYLSADPVTGDSSIPLAQRVDCLVCHANPSTGYAKAAKDWGRPASAAVLATAAQSVRRTPDRTNCGVCHMYAGGGDNVKLMGSSLKNPTTDLDVHMGAGTVCADCHVDRLAAPHTFTGGGVHVPGHGARAACTDCHAATPHDGVVPSTGAALDSHVAKIACQTCHIPRFSRGQFAKVDWDWSTSGDNSSCAGGTPCNAGVVQTKVLDDGTPDPVNGTAVTTYDFIKGNFVWKRNVVPAYRWSNGKSTHALVSDKADIGTLGTTPDDANRITLGEPVGSPTDGKIMPFKLMRGRQAVYVDGANSFVVNPNVFGPGSFWGVVQAVGFSFDAYDFDAAGPIAPGAESMAALWGKVLATGAVAAGQATGVTQFAKYDGVNPGYDWRYTKLYMDLNHEVAPKAQAIGAGGACADCHSATPRLPLCELYAGRPLPWGVSCP